MAKAKHQSGQSDLTSVVQAEQFLRWAEAMRKGDQKGAAMAKRDGAQQRLEVMQKQFQAGMISTSDMTSVQRELAEAEAELASLETKSAAADATTAAVSLPSDNVGGASETAAPRAVLSVMLVAASSGFSVNHSSSALGATPNVAPSVGVERLRCVWNIANPLTRQAEIANVVANIQTTVLPLFERFGAPRKLAEQVAYSESPGFMLPENAVRFVLWQLGRDEAEQCLRFWVQHFDDWEGFRHDRDALVPPRRIGGDTGVQRLGKLARAMKLGLDL